MLRKDKKDKKDKAKKEKKAKVASEAPAPAPAPAPPAPVDPVSVVITDAEIVRAQGAQVDRLRIDALTSVVVRTADSAPGEHELHWILGHADGAMVVPSVADGADELVGRLTRLDGFDEEAMVQAAASAAEATFDCWSRPG